MPPLYVMRIVQKRTEKGWSQTRLAQEVQLLGLDLSRAALANLERGERRLDPDDIPYFAAALGVDPNWLLGWDEFKKSKR